MKEVWKDIDGFSGLYQVSNKGRVKGMKAIAQHKNGRILTPSVANGYEYVQLFRDGKAKNFRVHRIVAKAFIENEKGKPEVNHIDGNKRNNAVYNLELATRSENEIHAYQVLNKQNPQKKIFDSDDVIIQRHLSGERCCDLAKSYGVSTSCISKILVRSGKSNGRRGFSNGQAKLSKREITEIQRSFIKGVDRYKDYAEKYNVSYQTISRAVNKKREG